jgi:ribulose-5-phosphate 4-epimerase/fuculose-1-phosphate aldolase
MTAIQDLLIYSKVLYDRRLVHGSGGNTSVRLGDVVWITQTGTVLGELTNGDLSEVGLDGEVLSGGEPSKELGMHLAMYHLRPEVQAIIHVHPTHAIAYSTLLTEASLDAIPAYTAAFYLRAGRVPVTDYYPSGSHELHDAVARLASYYHAILLRQHGVIVGAEDMATALGILEEIEQCCQIALLTRDAGAAITAEQKAAIDRKAGRMWQR